MPMRLEFAGAMGTPLSGEADDLAEPRHLETWWHCCRIGSHRLATRWARGSRFRFPPAAYACFWRARALVLRPRAAAGPIRVGDRAGPYYIALWGYDVPLRAKLSLSATPIGRASILNVGIADFSLLVNRTM